MGKTNEEIALDRAVQLESQAKDELRILKERIHEANEKVRMAIEDRMDAQLSFDLTRETCEFVTRSRYNDTCTVTGVIISRTMSGKTLVAKKAGYPDSSAVTFRKSKTGVWNEYPAPPRYRYHNGRRTVKLGGVKKR